MLFRKMNILSRKIKTAVFIGYRNIPILRKCSNNVPDFDMENPFQKEKQQCVLCKYKIHVDYKNVRLLSQFQSPYTGRIYSRHITRLCKKQQELVEKEIIKAQNAALMPTYFKDPKFLKDPLLFDNDKPLRPHRF
ncbi:28S ribosomal protein S18c, mitochondrial [Anoplophora glabripennis]|uniref:28S ribosomal protein S18c, mitochondrial n=1 Tax=Anoplophora glabripennis TaxID=217634 RepID=UPI0008735845|nr:28S ribosomal protein S18c, mitochondrial [Anoplophora glabripennis]